MFLYDKTNILEGVGIFEIDFAPSHEPANAIVHHAHCSASIGPGWWDTEDT